MVLCFMISACGKLTVSKMHSSKINCKQFSDTSSFGFTIDAEMPLMTTEGSPGTSIKLV